MWYVVGTLGHTVSLDLWRHCTPKSMIWAVSHTYTSRHQGLGWASLGGNTLYVLLHIIAGKRELFICLHGERATRSWLLVSSGPCPMCLFLLLILTFPFTVTMSITAFLSSVGPSSQPLNLQVVLGITQSQLPPCQTPNGPWMPSPLPSPSSTCPPSQVLPWPVECPLKTSVLQLPVSLLPQGQGHRHGS